METNLKYSCEAGTWQTESVMVLRDLESGATAMVAPALGSNCVSWNVRAQGQEWQVLETPATPQVLHERASRGGVPVLWPFSGRVRNAEYTYQGQTYHLPRTDKGGVHHIHGLALTSQWQVEDFGADENGAFVVTTLGPEQLAPAARSGYPFDFKLSLRFTLKQQSLTYAVTIENKEKQTALPFSFGIHPYFRVPLVPVGSPLDPQARHQCLVRIPAAAHWPTVDGLPTGPAQAVSEAKDFREWRELGAEPFDDMYSQVISDKIGGTDFSVAGLRTPGAGLQVLFKADAQFHDWVLFTPPDRAAVAVEPYTSPPNAINSGPAGLAGSNLLELAAGGSWQAQIIMEVSSF